MLCNAIICGVAWYHYTTMKDLWMVRKNAATIYRYIDWLITVPLQIAQFWQILKAGTPADRDVCCCLLLCEFFIEFIGE